MANSDKNILIVPNTNQTGLPNIQFVGSSSAPISLSVLDDNTLSFSGSQGQLFSINNNLTSGTIFSVNDVSGIPSIEVDASGTIILGEFGGNVGIGTGTPTHKLTVVGAISASVISASQFVGAGIGGGTPGGTNQTVQFNSGSTFSGSTNLVYNFTTNTLSGTTAQFTNLTSSVVSASTYLGLPFANSTFTPSISADLGPNGSSIRVIGTTYQNTTGRTLSIQIVLNCSTVGTRTAFVNQDFNAVNNGTATVVYSESAEGSRVLTVHFYVPAGHYYKITSDASETIGHWYEYQLFGGGGDVILSASNTFTGINTFNTNFITASAGITGSIARFTTISGSTISASNYVGLPFANSTFTPVVSVNLGAVGANTRQLATTYQNTTGRTLFLSVGVASSGSNSAYIYAGSDFTSVNNQTIVPVANATFPSYISGIDLQTFVPPGHYYRVSGQAGVYAANLWYEYELFGGGGDVILSASNTFTGVNTFNTNFVTASAGITGSIARFTSITGSTFFSASNPSYWSGSAPINIQDAINRVAAAIFNGITGSIA
jgi:hypothetical protein